MNDEVRLRLDNLRIMIRDALYQAHRLTDEKPDAVQITVALRRLEGEVALFEERVTRH